MLAQATILRGRLQVASLPYLFTTSTPQSIHMRVLEPWTLTFRNPNINAIHSQDRKTRCAIAMPAEVQDFVDEPDERSDV